MKRAVIIVAGGSGSRMNSNKPKQFIEVAGKPVLIWTMMRFLKFDPEIRMVLVLPAANYTEGEGLVTRFGLKGDIVYTTGGETRFHSVKNGLSFVGGYDLIAIHDGARPFVSLSTISQCFNSAEKYGGAVPATEVQDSLRIITEGGSLPVDRNAIRRVQTPQVFIGERILKAYNQEYRDVFTDDASVYETVYGPVVLEEGNRENIKITYPEDIELAALFLKQQDF